MKAGRGYVRKGSREKTVCVCAIMHKGRCGKMGVCGRGHWRDRGVDILHFNECIPDPQVSVFGGVPELSVSNETPDCEGCICLRQPWEAGRTG